MIFFDVIHSSWSHYDWSSCSRASRFSASSKRRYKLNESHVIYITYITCFVLCSCFVPCTILLPFLRSFDTAGWDRYQCCAAVHPLSSSSHFWSTWPSASTCLPVHIGESRCAHAYSLRGEMLRTTSIIMTLGNGIIDCILSVFAFTEMQYWLFINYVCKLYATAWCFEQYDGVIKRIDPKRWHPKTILFRVHHWGLC